MKNFKTYLILVLLTFGATFTSQAQVLRDANYNAIGRISPNGMVRDAKSISMGSFDADGLVKDKAGRAVGKIVRLEIFDNDGNRIGYINTDGTVRNGNSETLGTVSLNDGKVTNAEQQVLGYARGIRVDWIACYFFFDFFKK